jgi:hypothetical protein
MIHFAALFLVLKHQTADIPILLFTQMYEVSDREISARPKQFP